MDKEFETKEDMNIKENKEIINDKETTDESLDNTNETKKDYIKKEDIARLAGPSSGGAPGADP